MDAKDFFDDFAAAVAEKVINHIQPTEVAKKPERKKIRGIRGLAEYLGSSTRTIQKLKNNGALLYYQVGKNIFFYSDEVDEALRVNRKRR